MHKQFIIMTMFFLITATAFKSGKEKGTKGEVTDKEVSKKDLRQWEKDLVGKWVLDVNATLSNAQKSGEIISDAQKKRIKENAKKVICEITAKKFKTKMVGTKIYSYKLLSEKKNERIFALIEGGKVGLIFKLKGKSLSFILVGKERRRKFTLKRL